MSLNEDLLHIIRYDEDFNEDFWQEMLDKGIISVGYQRGKFLRVAREVKNTQLEEFLLSNGARHQVDETI